MADDFGHRSWIPISDLQNVIRTLAALALLLLAENVRLRSLEGPIILDDGLMKHIRNERVKLQATFLNTIAGGLAITGVIGPMATYLYGTTSETHRPGWMIVAEIAMLVLSSAALHALANVTLGRLEP